MRLKIFAAMVLFLALASAFPQGSPFNNTVFPTQTFTATGQTGSTIQLNGLIVPSTIGSSFASGTATLTGASLTTATFSMQGSADNGHTYFPLAIGAVSSPGSTTTTVTATGPGLYQVSLAGLTHVRFATSGTFTATNISLTLTASPNGLPTVLSGGGGGGAVSSVFGRTGAVVAASADYTFPQIAGSLTAAQVATAGTLTNTAAKATALATTPTPCAGSLLAGGIDASGNSINCAAGGGGGGSSVGSVGTIQAAGSTAGSFAAATPNNVNTGLGFSNGINVNGDSIAGSTGTTSTGVGNIALYNGFAQLLRNPVGGTFQELGASGDQAADGNLKWIYRVINPQGSGIDPVMVSELGTNDAIQYLGDANKQIIFQRVMLGSLVNAALPQTSKKFAQTCTLAGGFAASTATPFSTMAVTSTTIGSTVSCVTNSPKANDTLYVVYQIKDTNPGTFTVSLDGVPQNDPFNGTTTWNAFGDGGALIHTANNANSAYVAARFTGVSSGNHTILFTVTSATSAANIVEVEYVGAAPVAAAGNPIVYSVSPNQQNSGSAGAPFVAAYQGFIQTIDTNLTSDGLNVTYINTSAALLSSPLCGNGVQATMFTNCYTDNVHPNNLGHSVMANTILAVIPASLQLGVTTWNKLQPLQNFVAANSANFASLIGPQGFADINPNNISGDATRWGPGIKFNTANGNASWMGYQSATGLTIGAPSGVSGLQFCVSGGAGLMPALPPLTTACQFQWVGNGQFNFNSGSGTANGFTIQGGQVTGGTGVTWNVPGTMKFTSSVSGTYSTTLPTSVSTNNNSPIFRYFGGVWNGVTNAAAFDGPGWFAAAVNPTPAGQAAQQYLTLQVGIASQAGLDLRPATLLNFLGTSQAAAFTAASIGTNTNCSSAASPAVCGASASGSVAILAGTTVVVNTTAVTANSQIHITPDSSLGAKLGVTCETSGAIALAGNGVTARTAGASFTITTTGTLVTNPVCFSYSIVN